jgi:hypothetical protein
MLSRPKAPSSFPWLSALLGVGLALGLQAGGTPEGVIAAEPQTVGLPVPLELSPVAEASQPASDGSGATPVETSASSVPDPLALDAVEARGR